MEELKDRICVLECNIDDMTAEDLAFASERLMEEGARDVSLESIVMKKGRPATHMSVMCLSDDAEKERMAGLIFKYTTTIGIRETISERYILDRKEKTVETPYGVVSCKVVSGFGIKRAKPEYDDVSAIAKNRNISMGDARALIGPYLDKALNEEEERYV